MQELVADGFKQVITGMLWCHGLIKDRAQLVGNKLALILLRNQTEQEFEGVTNKRKKDLEWEGVWGRI